VSVRAYLFERPIIEEWGPLPRRRARRGYQRNLLIGLLLAAGLHLGAMLTGWGINAFLEAQREREATREVRIVPYRELGAPPSVEQKPAEVPKFAVAAPKFKAPPAGIPIPIPEEEAKVTTIATQEQMPFATAEGDTGLGGEVPDGVPWGQDQGGIVIEDEPDINAFVAVEQQPAAVEKPAPDYPEIAELAKIEGTVVVRALVGKDGKVKRVVLAKGVHGSLDQAAMDAAQKWVFQPAMQNKQPVQVWTTIPFRFSLHRK
jgi:protein TonB